MKNCTCKYCRNVANSFKIEEKYQEVISKHVEDIINSSEEMLRNNDNIDVPKYRWFRIEQAHLVPTE